MVTTDYIPNRRLVIPFLNVYIAFVLTERWSGVASTPLSVMSLYLRKRLRVTI
jgi:hypothetical protein